MNELKPQLTTLNVVTQSTPQISMFEQEIVGNYEITASLLDIFIAFLLIILSLMIYNKYKNCKDTKSSESNFSWFESMCYNFIL